MCSMTSLWVLFFLLLPSQNFATKQSVTKSEVIMKKKKEGTGGRCDTNFPVRPANKCHLCLTAQRTLHVLASALRAVTGSILDPIICYFFIIFFFFSTLKNQIKKKWVLGPFSEKKKLRKKFFSPKNPSSKNQRHGAAHSRGALNKYTERGQ